MMSLSLIERIRSLVKDRPQTDGDQITIRTVGYVGGKEGTTDGQPTTSRYQRLIQLSGMDPSVVEKKCSERDAYEWCEWLEELLRGREGHPPSSPLTDSLFDVLAALVAAGVTHPLIVGLVRERSRVGEHVRALAREASQSLTPLMAGKRKEAVEGLSEVFKKIIDTARRLALPREGVAAEVTSLLEEELRGKHKVPLSPGELVNAVVESIKEGPEAASVAVTALLQERRKEPTQLGGVAKEIKEVGGVNEVEVELSKKPYVRIGG